MPNTRPELIFDGDCAFCSKHAKRTAARGVATSTAKDREAVLAEHDLQDASADSVVWITQGRSYTRSAAIVRAMWAMGGAWKIGAAALWLVPKPVRDAGYRWVARNRHRL